MSQAPPHPDELEEQTFLFNAFYEDDLEGEELQAFEERLETDEAFAQDFEQFSNVVGGLRNLPFEFAPDDFEERLKSRIRTRSSGRFFADNYLFTDRVPYEVVAVVMMVIMAATYLLMEAPRGSIEDVKVVPELRSR